PHGRLEVQLHVSLDVRPSLLSERAAPGRSRVVDEQVQLAAVLAFHDLPDVIRCIGLGQVGGYHRSAAEVACQLLYPGLSTRFATRHEHQLAVALTGEPARSRLANSA